MSVGLDGVKGDEGDLADLVKHRFDLLIGHGAVGTEQAPGFGNGKHRDLASAENAPRCQAPDSGASRGQSGVGQVNDDG
ncbi:MAG: hypothetical protein QF481_11970 [Acidimicrobiales bacterium]|nr:hypothetical protein [Acidimicrobiales bacterium]